MARAQHPHYGSASRVKFGAMPRRNRVDAWRNVVWRGIALDLAPRAKHLSALMPDIFVRGIRGGDKFVMAGHNGAFQKRSPFSRDNEARDDSASGAVVSRGTASRSPPHAARDPSRRSRFRALNHPGMRVLVRRQHHPRARKLTGATQSPVSLLHFCIRLARGRQKCLRPPCRVFARTMTNLCGTASPFLK